MTEIGSPESGSMVTKTKMPSSLTVFLAGGNQEILDELKRQAEEAKENRRRNLENSGLRVGHGASGR